MAPVLEPCLQNIGVVRKGNGVNGAGDVDRTCNGPVRVLCLFRFTAQINNCADVVLVGKIFQIAFGGLFEGGGAEQESAFYVAAVFRVVAAEISGVPDAVHLEGLGPEADFPAGFRAAGAGVNRGARKHEECGKQNAEGCGCSVVHSYNLPF